MSALSVLSCSTSTSDVFLLYIFVGISCFLVLSGLVWRVGVLGFFGGGLLLISGLYIISCIGLLGYGLGLIGVLLMLFFGIGLLRSEEL